MSMVGLTAYIEKTFELRIPDSDIHKRHVATLDTLTDLARSLRGSAPRSGVLYPRDEPGALAAGAAGRARAAADRRRRRAGPRADVELVPGWRGDRALCVPASGHVDPLVPPARRRPATDGTLVERYRRVERLAGAGGFFACDLHILARRSISSIHG